MLQRLCTIAVNTLVETIRQPLYGVILLATTILLILNVSLAGFTLDDDNKLLYSLGLSTLLLSGLFLSGFSASGVLSREIENKTVLTVISKPVSRPLFVAGKFLGLTGAICIAYYLSTLVFILTIRHGVMENTSDPWDAPVLTLGLGSVLIAFFVGAARNYLRGSDFPTTVIASVAPLLTLAVVIVGFFDEHWNRIPFASNYVGGQIIISAYLVMLAVIITAAVALAASTRFGQLVTLLICVVVLGLGIISDYAFGQHIGTYWTAKVAYGLIPNIGPFWIIDGLHAGTETTAVGLPYLGYVTAYAALLATGILAIAVMAFQKREVG